MAIAKLKGKWRMDEMALWDKDYLDMLEPAYIEFKLGGMGSFHFGCIYAEIDYGVAKTNKGEKAEFTFVGDDEGEEICGRGWAKVVGHELYGHLYFHKGDHSSFKARRTR